MCTTISAATLEHFHYLEKKPHPSAVIAPTSAAPGTHQPAFCPFGFPHLDIAFKCVWLLLLVMFSRFIHVVTQCLILLMTE